MMTKKNSRFISAMRKMAQEEMMKDGSNEKILSLFSIIGGAVALGCLLKYMQKDISIVTGFEITSVVVLIEAVLYEIEIATTAFRLVCKKIRMLELSSNPYAENNYAEDAVEAEVSQYKIIR
jgi:hypothetical protein